MTEDMYPLEERLQDILELKSLIGTKIISLEFENDDYSDNIAFLETDKGTLVFQIHDPYANLELADGIEDLRKMIGETVLETDITYSELDESENMELDSGTWIYYKIKTFNHDVRLRFLGSSNEKVYPVWKER